MAIIGRAEWKQHLELAPLQEYFLNRDRDGALTFIVARIVWMRERDELRAAVVLEQIQAMVMRHDWTGAQFELDLLMSAQVQHEVSAAYNDHVRGKA